MLKDPIFMKYYDPSIDSSELFPNKWYSLSELTKIKYVS